MKQDQKLDNKILSMTADVDWVRRISYHVGSGKVWYMNRKGVVKLFEVPLIYLIWRLGNVLRKEEEEAEKDIEAYEEHIEALRKIRNERSKITETDALCKTIEETQNKK